MAKSTKKKKKNNAATFIVAGYTPHELHFSAGPASCGHITDGASIEHGNEGKWVIDYKDLQTMYEMATAARD